MGFEDNIIEDFDLEELFKLVMEVEQALRRISINNYKLFNNFELCFSDGVSLICGSNGSGKSSLLEILQALSAILAMPDNSDRLAVPISEAFPINCFTRWNLENSGSGDLDIVMELDDEKDRFEYSLTVRYNFLNRQCRVQKERLVYYEDSHCPSELINVASGKIEMLTDDKKPLAFSGDWNMSGLVMGSRNNSHIRKFGSLFELVTAIHIFPPKMTQESTFAPVPPAKTLGRWGENFPAWRYNRVNEESFKQFDILKKCRYFIPGLESLDDISVGDRRRLSTRVNYNHNPYVLSFNELSDGQQKLIAMYTIVEYAEPHSTIAIDEPENYLAPSELQPWLNAMQNAWEEKDIQFIILSHHPKTLNWHHDEAFIMEITGEPPYIKVYKNAQNKSLIEQLIQMGWTN